MTQQKVGIARRKLLQKVLVAIIGAAVVVLGVRVVQVHDSTSDWGIVAPALPSKFVFDGQVYLKSSKVGPLYSPPESGVAAGKTDGGGQILIPSYNATSGTTPNWLAVSADGIEYTYISESSG